MFHSVQGPLYPICDLAYVAKENALDVSRKILAAGPRVLQLRAKNHHPWELVSLACDLKSLCDQQQAHFIINDHPHLAAECQSHGLHLGQDDGSLAEARTLLGNDIILGRSTHSLDQARAALAEGFDYIGFGPLYPTPTKEGRPAIGLENISTVMAEVGSQIPVFCIGGITPETLPRVLDAGAKNVVIVSHLLKSPDIVAETSRLVDQLTNY